MKQLCHFEANSYLGKVVKDEFSAVLKWQQIDRLEGNFFPFTMKRILIWMFQVDQGMFDKTVSTNNALSQNLTRAIKEDFDIEWSSVKWSDLTKPLYSAIAARFYISLQLNSVNKLFDDIARDIPGQAKFWKDSYRDGGDVSQFEERARRMQQSKDKNHFFRFVSHCWNKNAFSSFLLELKIARRLFKSNRNWVPNLRPIKRRKECSIRPYRYARIFQVITEEGSTMDSTWRHCRRLPDDSTLDN